MTAARRWACPRTTLLISKWLQGILSERTWSVFDLLEHPCYIGGRTDTSLEQIRRAIAGEGPLLENTVCELANLIETESGGRMYYDFILYAGEGEFRGAEFPGIQLRGEDLSEMDFTGANLSGANLAGALVEGARFDRAKLHQADLTGLIGQASFSGCDLSSRRVNIQEI